MKNVIKALGVIAIVAVIGFSLASCGNDGNNSGGGGWDGQDISNWPEWSETRMYFRVTDDKQVMAINSAGRGDGQGKWIPDIFVIQLDSRKGTFPIGGWHSYDHGGGDLVFTDTTFTRWYNGVAISYDYRISGDYFLLTPHN